MARVMGILPRGPFVFGFRNATENANVRGGHNPRTSAVSGVLGRVYTNAAKVDATQRSALEA